MPQKGTRFKTSMPLGGKSLLCDTDDFDVGRYDKGHLYVHDKVSGRGVLIKDNAKNLYELKGLIRDNYKRMIKAQVEDSMRKLVATRTMVGGLIVVKAAYLSDKIVSKMKESGVLPKTDAEFLAQAKMPPVPVKAPIRLHRVKRDKSVEMPWLADKLTPVKAKK